MNRIGMLTDLRARLEYAEERVEELEAELRTLRGQNPQPTPTRRPVKTEVKMSEIEVYAQEAISKITVEIAKLCERLNSETNNRMAKEYIYLALGRGEIVKAEILDILSQDIDDNTKKARIDNEVSAAMDYYTSISNQIR